MSESNNSAPEPFKRRLEEFHKLTSDERSELAVALVRRDVGDRRDRAQAMLRQKYPAASAELIGSGAFHAYIDLPTALRDCMAWLELCLRLGDHEQHAGINFEVLYHLYNWLQAEALMPWGQQSMFDELKEVKDCLENDDKDGAVATLEKLMERFEAHVAPPDVEA